MDIFDISSETTKLITPENIAAFLVKPQGYVGGYRLGNIANNYVQFNLPYKPNWLHRQCMRIFLGWYWIDDIK